MLNQIICFQTEVIGSSVIHIVSGFVREDPDAEWRGGLGPGDDNTWSPKSQSGQENQQPGRLGEQSRNQHNRQTQRQDNRMDKR